MNSRKSLHCVFTWRNAWNNQIQQRRWHRWRYQVNTVELPCCSWWWLCAALCAPRLTSEKHAGCETRLTRRGFFVISVLERHIFRKHLYFLFLFLFFSWLSLAGFARAQKQQQAECVRHLSLHMQRAQDKNKSETGKLKLFKFPGTLLNSA